MKTFIANNWFKIVLTICLLLIGFSIFFYFVFYLPQKEMDRKLENENSYKACQQACTVNIESSNYVPVADREAAKECLAKCNEKYGKPLPDLLKLPEIR